MTEQDKQIQDLRRENERLAKWVDELENKLEEWRRFYEWMKNTGFGEEQLDKIVEQYYEDTNRKLS